MISQETINAVLDRTEIVQVIRQYVPELTKRGADYVCRCPFHEERTASFHVSPARQTWHCFGGCAEGGNVITFLMKKEALTFPQAVQQLARRYGIECLETQEADDVREERLHREALWGINERAAAYYAGLLYSPIGKDALAYAEGRFGKEYVREAGLGFAPAEPRNFCDWAREHGENFDLLLELNLIGRNEQKGYYYDFYRNRLLFPIRDRARHVVGFTARDLSGDNECKYLNSKESLAYHKKESVFGIDAAWREASRQELFFLVEGAPDAARMQSVGINNAVAPLGGAWTHEQLASLRRAADCLCFINDADPPKEGGDYGTGIAYVMKNGRTALELGFTVSVRELPLGAGNTKQDPGSFFTSSAKLNLLKEEEFVLWCAKKWWHKEDNSNRMLANIRRIAELASLIKDETRLDLLIDELSKLKRGKEMWRNQIHRAKWAREDAKKADIREVNLRTYGFVEERGCYYGITDKGDEQWTNFTLKPLFHIMDNDRPRRLYELRGAGSKRKVLLDLDMEELNSISKFRKKLEGLGNYIWSAGEQEMIKLKSYLYDNTQVANIVTQMGWNTGGFYAWGNGIWMEEGFRVTDEFGIVHTGEGEKAQFWYIPAAAKNGDTASYERQRRFVHRSLQKVKFGEYMKDFVTVYGDNGKIGLCYWLASLFRDVVTATTRSFPILDLFGPKGSGKTELGAALMAFFIVDNKAPNLKNSTPIALNDDVAYACDALVHFDEYKNDLNPKMIEFLKGLYDGVGRTKMGGANFGDRKMTPVKTGVIMSGQEIPTADIALFHRCVFLPFQRSEFSIEERQRFAALRTRQECGLTDLTLVALAQRKRVQGNFMGAYAEVCDRITRETHNAPLETRIVENWAKILAVFRCVEERLPFPFSFEEILQTAIRGLVKQNSMSGEGNELAHFWRTVMYLRDNGDLFEKGDYHIKAYSRFSSDIINGREYSSPREILLLNTSRVFMLYKEAARRSGDKIIPDDALREYIKNTDYYLGYLKSVRFTAMPNGYEQREQDTAGVMRPVSRVTRAMAFDYEALKEKYGITLDTSTSSSQQPTGEEGLSMTNCERLAAPVEAALPF